MTRGLGTVQAVDVRSVWSSEAGDFTPWLAEPANLALLAETVALDLEVQAQEKRIGAFRADILCKDLTSGNWVLIENQLERSDHGHLGQLLTYAGGLDAATIIWVTPEFCDEHRAAIDWLNRMTDDRVNLFAVKIEVWSISGSLPAPRFTIVAGPNNWDRTVKKAGREVEAERSESAQRRFEYWQTFLAQLRLSDKEIGVPRPNSLGNLRFSLQGRDLWITVYNSVAGRIGVFVRSNGDYFSMLANDRRSIEARIGEPVKWESDAKGGSVTIVRDADPTNRADWPSQHQWLGERLQKFLDVFKPYVR